MQGTAAGLMGLNISCRNVQTGLRQGQEPDPLVSVLILSSVNKP